MSESYIPEEARNFAALKDTDAEQSEVAQEQKNSPIMNALRERARGIMAAMVLTMGMGLAGRAEAAEPPVTEAGKTEKIDKKFEGGRVMVAQKRTEGVQIEDQVGNETATRIVFLEDPTPNVPGDEVLTKGNLYHWQSGENNNWQVEFNSEGEAGVAPLFGRIDGVPDWLLEKARDTNQLNLLRDSINMRLKTADAKLRALRGLRQAGLGNGEEARFIQNSLKKQVETFHKEYPGLTINSETEKEIDG